MPQVLDFGYCNLIESWGSDSRIIEAARMSTDKGFQGWGPKSNCKHCGAYIDSPNLLTSNSCSKKEHDFSGDEKLLRYLWEHKHSTPFEMAGMTIEVQVPIFVAREWHRHRTQSYSELSSRYTSLHDLYYIPSVERLMAGKQSKSNKQSSDEGFTEKQAFDLRGDIGYQTQQSRNMYNLLLERGVSRELARLVIPMNQYTRFRASANLRNWCDFLRLRLHESAQLEIRCYAKEVAILVKDRFPRTMELLDEELQP